MPAYGSTRFVSAVTRGMAQAAAPTRTAISRQVSRTRVSAPQPDLLGRNCASGRFRLYASRAGRKDFAGVGMALARSGAFGKLDPPYPSIVNSLYASQAGPN